MEILCCASIFTLFLTILITNNVQAKNVVCCLEHEIVIRNKNRCQMEKFTCDYDPTKPLDCPCEPDPPFCWCKPGYVRDLCGFCVKKESCKKGCYVSHPIDCPAMNETLYGCYDPSINRLCPHLRSSDSSTSSSSCQSNGLIVLNVCGCKPGYYLNECDQCVLLCDCRKKCTLSMDQPCSDPNAERVACRLDLTKKTCEQIVNKKKSICNICEDGMKSVCICKEGFALDKCGRCIPEAECWSNVPCKCTCPCNMKKHQDWRCFDFCYERTCEYLDPRVQRRCTLPCRYGCDCVIDYWRFTDESNPDAPREQKKCIPTQKCPQSSISFPYPE